MLKRIDCAHGISRINNFGYYLFAATDVIVDVFVRNATNFERTIYSLLLSSVYSIQSYLPVFACR